MKRNASPETLQAVLGGNHTNYRRTLLRIPNDTTVPKDPEDLRLACRMVESNIVGKPGLHLPIIDAAFGADDESEQGTTVAIQALQGGNTESLSDVLLSHDINLSFTEEQAVVGALRTITLKARRPDTFAVCDASVDTHRHIYVQEPFNDEEHARLFEGLHLAGVISDRMHQLVEEIGSSAARVPWSVREVEARRPTL